MVAQNLVLNKIILIRHAVSRIRSRRHLSEAQFLQDADAQDVVLFNFQIAIQGCLDLADHLISDEEWGIPGSFGEAMDKLAEHGLFSMEAAERYKKMGRFRNLVVHGYARVDMREVYKIMSTGPESIEKFVEAFAEYCKL